MRRTRESLGMEVREEWIAWAGEQPNPKPSWLVPWDGLSEPDKEVDRRIGERLARIGRTEARAECLGVCVDVARSYPSGGTVENVVCSVVAKVMDAIKRLR